MDHGRNISPSMLDALLLANPTDVYRMLNLAGTSGVSAFAGLAGLSSAMTLGEAMLVAALLLWIFLPLSLAANALLAEGTIESPGAPPYHSSHSLRLRPKDRGTNTAPFPSHAQAADTTAA